MITLEQLKKLNPELKLFSVLDKEFEELGYGHVLSLGDTAQLAKAVAATEIPESGNVYVRSDSALESVDIMDAIKTAAFGLMPIEAGVCNGHGFTLNALEYHRCSEVNFTTTGLVLLLALPSQIHDGRLNSADICGFYLPPEVLIEVSPLVMHFAPCRISEDGFNCLVVLEDGTNCAIDCVDTTAAGERKLLWMQNKWMTCHPDSPQAEKGAFQGIYGENIKLCIE